LVPIYTTAIRQFGELFFDEEARLRRLNAA
jgi:hypothetical protein